MTRRKRLEWRSPPRVESSSCKTKKADRFALLAALVGRAASSPRLLVSCWSFSPPSSLLSSWCVRLSWRTRDGMRRRGAEPMYELVTKAPSWRRRRGLLVSGQPKWQRSAWEKVCDCFSLACCRGQPASWSSRKSYLLVEAAVPHRHVWLLRDRWQWLASSTSPRAYLLGCDAFPPGRIRPPVCSETCLPERPHVRVPRFLFQACCPHN